MTDQLPDPAGERRAKRIAADFKPNETYDQLLELRDADSPRWADVGRSSRLAVALYERQRQVAADQGVDTTRPPV